MMMIMMIMMMMMMMIRDVGTNDYEGFVPPDDNWVPQRFTTMLSKDDFHAFIRRREPFIISYNDVGLMEDALEWNTAQWRHPSTGTQYLIDKVSQIYTLMMMTTIDDDNDDDDSDSDEIVMIVMMMKVVIVIIMIVMMIDGDEDGWMLLTMITALHYHP